MNLAGPLANLVLAVALLAATRQFYNPEHPVFWSAVAFLAFLQITALVVKPAADPGPRRLRRLEPHLSPETQRAVQPAKQFGFLILVVLLLAPALNHRGFSVVLWFSSTCPRCRGRW